MAQTPKAKKVEKTISTAAEEGAANPSLYVGVELLIDLSVPEAIIQIANGETVGPIPYAPGISEQEIRDDIHKRLKRAAECASNGLANVTIKPISPGSDSIQ